MNKNQEIRSLYEQVKRKTTAIQAVADKCDRAFNYVKGTWLSPSGGWSVPEEHEDKVIATLKKVVKSDNQ